MTQIHNVKQHNSDKMLTKELLCNALKEALMKVDKLLVDMGTDFPKDSSVNNIYDRTQNTEGWTQGFWCGILWLSYEMTKEDKYRNAAEALLESFYVRIEKKLGVNTHDLGFLYMPSCVAAYKLTGNETAKQAALQAAEYLITRYHVNGGYIQAWGNMGEQLRMIADCMNNLPLLYWASEVTGDKKYYEIAYNHAKTTVQYIIRNDGSTYHTFFFNKDGSPAFGSTHQGATDDSCWARGQAWMISGLALSYKYTLDNSFITQFKKVTNYYLKNIPVDYVPYWDFIFCDGDGETKDSSAAAIAVCGMLEMLPHLLEDDEQKEFYQHAIKETIISLISNYSTKDTPQSNGLLLHAVYNKNKGIGVDECNIWGCYYYMEALARLIKGLNGYW